MALKTFKELKENKKAEVGFPSSASVIQKKNKKGTTKVKAEDDKEYYLQHPDFPSVCDCYFIVDKKSFEVKDGLITTTNKEDKDKLIQSGMRYLGYKKNDIPYYK